ncbi:amidase [Streptomyces sp. NBC_00663]|uniref:amidase n=1 Tax=Streptomyces sp. NBC_00663 TaxID=2975801 RepID=UPI002E3716B8|nr:amidase [Streptomyces sp. NBC_00663]
MASPARPTELWQFGAAELATAVRSREVSAVEAAQSCLDRIEQTNPTLNALADVRTDEVLSAARAADDALAAGKEVGPLHGVPVSIKINTEQRGHATSNGLPALAHSPAEHDAACVSALRDAGALPLGRSNAPAFSLRWFTSNALHGRTLNPWDHGRTPGGSSGGAASSLAAGMTPLAQGNDIGGSIRFPAACCGVVGLRPTVGRISDWAPPAVIDTPGGPVEMSFPPTVHFCAVQGPLGRTVTDVRLALRAMTAPDLRDPSGVPAVPDRPRAAGPVKVRMVRTLGTLKNHPAVDRALDSAAAHLTDAGHEIEELTDFPLLAEASRLWALLLTEDTRSLLPTVEQLGDDDIRAALAGHFAAAAQLWGEQPSLQTYIDGWARRATLITRLQEFLGRDTVLLTPVCAEPAFEQDADVTDPERSKSLASTMWPMTSVPILGFPAVTVPVLVDEGLPFSVQVIGGRFEEELVLEMAHDVETRAAVPQLWNGTGA